LIITQRNSLLRTGTRTAPQRSSISTFQLSRPYSRHRLHRRTSEAVAERKRSEDRVEVDTLAEDSLEEVHYILPDMLVEVLEGNIRPVLVVGLGADSIVVVVARSFAVVFHLSSSRLRS